MEISNPRNHLIYSNLQNKLIIILHTIFLFPLPTLKLHSRFILHMNTILINDLSFYHQFCTLYIYLNPTKLFFNNHSIVKLCLIIPTIRKSPSLIICHQHFFLFLLLLLHPYPTTQLCHVILSDSILGPYKFVFITPSLTTPCFKLK